VDDEEVLAPLYHISYGLPHDFLFPEDAEDIVLYLEGYAYEEAVALERSHLLFRPPGQ